MHLLFQRYKYWYFPSITKLELSPYPGPRTCWLAAQRVRETALIWKLRIIKLPQITSEDTNRAENWLWDGNMGTVI